MARKKKVTEEVVETTPVLDVLAQLTIFRNEKEDAAKLTDSARDKFAVLAIDEFLGRLKS